MTYDNLVEELHWGNDIDRALSNLYHKHTDSRTRAERRKNTRRHYLRRLRFLRKRFDHFDWDDPEDRQWLQDYARHIYRLRLGRHNDCRRDEEWEWGPVRYWWINHSKAQNAIPKILQDIRANGIERDSDADRDTSQHLLAQPTTEVDR